LALWSSENHGLLYDGLSIQHLFFKFHSLNTFYDVGLLALHPTSTVEDQRLPFNLSSLGDVIGVFLWLIKSCKPPEHIKVAA
jgi:hypothetical protein